LRWTYSTEGNIYSSPAAGYIERDGELKIVIGTRNMVGGKLYILNANGTLASEWQTPGGIVGSPTLADFNNNDTLENRNRVLLSAYKGRCSSPI